MQPAVVVSRRVDSDAAGVALVLERKVYFADHVTVACPARLTGLSPRPSTRWRCFQVSHSFGTHLFVPCSAVLGSRKAIGHAFLVLIRI